MVGYKATQIRMPESEVEFEKNVGVLFRAVLNDPNVKRAGRRGQPQQGVDLVGHRDRQSSRLVGIQCKLKGEGRKLSTTEVRTEVRKALKYKPLLKEYFIVTTAPDDIKLQQLAQRLTQQQFAKGRKIHIDIWGRGTLEERINEFKSAKEAFDPGFSPSVQAQQVLLEELSHGQQVLATKAQVEDIANKLQGRAAGADMRLPEMYADRELKDELSRVLRRRGFAEANVT
jgi:hypothetical protein